MGFQVKHKNLSLNTAENPLSFMQVRMPLMVVCSAITEKHKLLNALKNGSKNYWSSLTFPKTENGLTND